MFPGPDQIVPALLLKLCHGVVTFVAAVCYHDGRQIELRTVRHLHQEFVLVGDVLTLDDGVGVGAVHEVVKRADFGHVERLLPPCALEVAVRIRGIGGELHV